MRGARAPLLWASAMDVAAVRAPGHGAIAFDRRADRTFVRSARAESPLKLLTPRNHGHAAWVVVASFGGGLVDGDSLALDIEVSEGAAGLVGTQASTKVYRCPTSACRQDTTARVADGALLVMIPDPVAAFADARYEQSVRVDLAASASIVMVDAFTSGRAARGERWDFRRYAARTEIARAGSPILVDAIVLDPDHGDLHTRMGRFDAFATIVIAGPRTATMMVAARELPAPSRRAPIAIAVSPIADDAIVVRVAGTSVEEVTKAVRARLAGLDDLLGDDPFARKW